MENQIKRLASHSTRRKLKDIHIRSRICSQQQKYKGGKCTYKSLMELIVDKENRSRDIDTQKYKISGLTHMTNNNDKRSAKRHIL